MASAVYDGAEGTEGEQWRIDWEAACTEGARPHPMALSVPTDSEVLCPSVSSLRGPPGPLPSTATFETDPEEDATSKRELLCSMRNWGT